jgi:hypothetical protein
LPRLAAPPHDGTNPAGGSSSGELFSPAGEPPDLPARLAEAREIELPLIAEVARHEQALTEALERADYPAAEATQNALPAARQALAIASVTVQALQQAVSAIEAQRQADEQAILRRRQQDQHSRDLAAARERAREAGRECAYHLAAVDTGLVAIREGFQAAQEAEGRRISAERAAEAAEVALGHREAPRYYAGASVCQSRLDN